MTGDISSIKCMTFHSYDTSRLLASIPAWVQDLLPIEIWRCVAECLPGTPVLGCSDGTIRVPESTTVLRGHKASIFQLCMVDNILVSASYDTYVGVWDMTRGTNIAFLSGHTSTVHCVTTNRKSTCTNDSLQNPTLILSGGWERTVRIWHLKSLSCLRVIDVDDWALFVCVYKHKFVIGLHTSITVWDNNLLKKTCYIDVYHTVHSLALCRDWIVCAMSNGHVKVVHVNYDLNNDPNHTAENMTDICAPDMVNQQYRQTYILKFNETALFLSLMASTNIIVAAFANGCIGIWDATANNPNLWKRTGTIQNLIPSFFGMTLNMQGNFIYYDTMYSALGVIDATTGTLLDKTIKYDLSL